jgi:hypothetical protein
MLSKVNTYFSSEKIMVIESTKLGSGISLRSLDFFLKIYNMIELKI